MILSTKQELLQQTKRTVFIFNVCLPPTKQELLQQIIRTVFISNVWCNAHMRCPTEKLPENYGLTIMDNKYQYYWFDGPQSPSYEELSSYLQESDVTNEQSEEEGDEDKTDAVDEDDEDLSDESDEY
ncbi:unnamed protein product [Psylliodes chrysocephalus]|uniref:Uncharacterized protein n=1 Tax=Psylliodes chrysocephalus TaxID=3402493 RepID=A0A9P0CU51_9CUCU|nr:unnamed protein product [Psylliodes chrysocephala]